MAHYSRMHLERSTNPSIQSSIVLRFVKVRQPAKLHLTRPFVANLLPRINSTLSANPPSVLRFLHKPSLWTRIQLSSLRSGIRLARSDTNLSPPCTIETPTALLLYTILRNLYVEFTNLTHCNFTDSPKASLDKAKAWVKELQRQANENIIIALAGNKLDLVTEQPDKRAIPTADAEAYAQEAGLLFFETSAKTAENVRELFTAIAKKLPLDQAGPRHARPGQRPGVTLQPESGNTNAGGQCSC